MNKKSYSFDLETFINMFQICPKVHGHKFVDPPFEEEILVFMSDLGYSGNIKSLSEVKVEIIPQPWRTFGTIINKCLSGKVTRLDLLRLSQAQILWGMYHQKNINYVYLLWEYLVYQIEYKVSKRNKDMYYPRFTKFIINHFMSQDQSYPRRNKVDWHMASDDPILTIMRFTPQHEVVQKKAITKPKYVRRTTKEKTEQAPKASSGKRIKAIAKIKLAIERSKTQIHSSQPNGLGAHEGIGVKPGVPDVPTYKFDDEQISWKSNDEEDDDDVVMSDDADDNDDQNADDTDNEDDDDQNDDNAYNESDDDQDDDQNVDDNLVHPKLSTFDEKERQDGEDKEEEWFDDDKNQGTNVEGEELDEEETNEEDKANELYRDVNVNLEGRDTEMTDAPHTIAQTTQVIEDTHVTITPVNLEVQQQSYYVSSGFISNMLNPSPDTGIDSIFNLNTESTSLVDVPVTTIAETPLSSVTTLPPPPIPLITHLQQTPVPTPTTVSSSSLHALFNFVVSLIPGIIDMYLANKMNEAVKIVVQLQSNRLRDEAQAKNEDFINKLNDNIKKIIKEQVKEQVKAQVSKILPKIEKTVNEQLEAEVLTHSSNESKTSHAVAANLSELELKKILIDKMERNKSIYRSDEQNNLYKALVDAYESDKLILDTYGDTVLFKRCRDDEDKGKEPFAGLNRGTLAQKEDTRDSFDELMDTPLDFSAFVMNQLKVDILTPELLAGPTFELIKGSCKSLRKPLPLIPNLQGRRVIPFDHFINNDLAYLRGGTSSQTYATSVTKTKATDYGHIKWIEDLVPNTMESARDVYSKHRIIAVIKLQIFEWHNYKHLDWITICRNDDKLYTFKNGDYKRLLLQDIKDILLLLVQGKPTNLTIEERLALNVSLQMFTRSIVIQRRMEDLQLGVESFIYQNKDKKNKLMRIDELHKFSDGTLNNVRTALDDILKRIRM
ncbi:hypothetical protein Tco_0830851, partial [Tanacetum coccineum]